MTYVKQSTRKKHTVSSKLDRGLVNSLINKLSVELHFPGYQYCGPDTKLEKRLARGDLGKNPLDAACKQHDIAYTQQPNEFCARHRADNQLEQADWERFKSKDAKFGERPAAWLVTNMMKGKQRLGMGCRVQKSKMKRSITKKRMSNKRIKKNNLKRKKFCKKVAFGSGIVNKVHNTLRSLGGNRLISYGLKKASDIALNVACKHLKSVGGKPIPKVSGLLLLLPIFAKLFALGSLAVAATGITKAVQTAKSSREQLEEANCHNKKKEAIPIVKSRKRKEKSTLTQKTMR